MIKVDVLVFSPFQENTYILSDETKECVIVDPGCLGEQENAKLVEFIDLWNLKPVKTIFTHLHLDHVFGSRFVKNHYKIPMVAHADDEGVLKNTREYATMFGISMDDDPASIDQYVGHGDTLQFGNSELAVRHVPGHSPGGVVYYSEADKICIAGDVLFRLSIGRTDLPGGNHQQLIEAIQQQVFTLPADTVVFPGHGGSTTIGFERENNPFF